MLNATMVDPLSVGAIAKAVESAADEGGKGAGGLVSRVFGPAADEIGQALGRWTSYRVGNVKRIAEVADRKSIASGRDGMINPRLARSLLEEGSYCDDELMVEYFGGILAGGRSPRGQDDRAVSWASLIASMSSIQVRLHFILYREWAYALHGMEDETIATRQNVGMIYADAQEIINALREDHADIGDMSISTHALAGLSRLDLIGTPWNVGGVSLLRRRYIIPDLPFTGTIQAVPSHAGMELFGWACGRPGYRFEEFMRVPEVIEFDVQVPRPTVVLPYLRQDRAGGDSSSVPPNDPAG
jgi:hypothetical protein